MKTILITGANGFVAWYLIRDLLQEPYKIIATGKGASRLPFTNERLVYETLDFTNEANVNAVFETHKPDVVVHAGAQSKPDECELHQDAAYNTNVRGTELLLHAAKKCRSYFLFVSTDFVFAGTNLNYTEADAPAPVNYYGQTKLWAEAAVQNYPFRWGILRPILVYGKPTSGRQNLLTMVADALRDGKPLQIFNDQTRKPTYVEDVAQALTTMIRNQSTGIFHVCGPDAKTPYAIAVAVAQHLDFDAQQIKEVTAATFQQPAARPPITGFDLTKAATELSFRPTSFAEGLRKTFEG